MPITIIKSDDADHHGPILVCAYLLRKSLHPRCKGISISVNPVNLEIIDTSVTLSFRHVYVSISENITSLIVRSYFHSCVFVDDIFMIELAPIVKTRTRNGYIGR